MENSACTIAHSIPGRVRISVPNLKHNPLFANHIMLHLSSIPGVQTIEPNTLTGRVLLTFSVKQVSVPTLIKEIETAKQLIYTQNSYPSRQISKETAATLSLRHNYPLVYTLITGILLFTLLLRRYVWRQAPRAFSQNIFNLAALLTILTGYPLLENGIRNFAERRQINANLILFTATVILLSLRESISGLSILWIVQLSNLSHHLIRQKMQKNIDKLLDRTPASPVDESKLVQYIVSQKRPKSGPYSNTYSRSIAVWTIMLVATSLLVSRNYARILTLLLAGCPVAINLSRYTALGMGAVTAIKQKALIRNTEYLEKIGQTQVIILDTVAGLQNSLPRLKGIQTVDSDSLGNPSAQLAFIRKLQLAGKNVLVVSDGSKDLTAFTNADISIALGPECTDTTLKWADIIITEKDAKHITQMITLGQRTNKIIQQNMAAASSFAILGLVSGFNNLITPATASLLLNLSTATVIGNSLRLVRKQNMPG